MTLTSVLTSILLWGADPTKPMIIGALLYVWTGVALYYSDKPYFGSVWFMYALANLFLVFHTTTGR